MPDVFPSREGVAPSRPAPGGPARVRRAAGPAVRAAAARPGAERAVLMDEPFSSDGTLREGFFLDLLRRGFSADEARRQLDIAIDWGRYGELFEYDAESGQLVLDPGKVGT